MFTPGLSQRLKAERSSSQFGIMQKENARTQVRVFSR
jgi:hypothetical protein